VSTLPPVLGIEQTDAHRAIKVDSLSDEAKAAAREHHLDDNRSALLTAARESDTKDQVAKIVELAVQKTKIKPAPIEASKEDEQEEAIDFFVEADVPGSAATNKLIKKVVDFWESIDPSFTAWTENDPDEGAVGALRGVLQMAFQPIWRGRLRGGRRLRSGDPMTRWNLKERLAALGSNRIGLDFCWSRLAPRSCWPGLPSEFETNFANALGVAQYCGRGFRCSSHVSSWHIASVGAVQRYAGVGARPEVTSRPSKCFCRVGPGNFTPSLSQIRT
jgi:hypothetical protein